MLYLERHKLYLHTFPEGNFSHTIIPSESAKELIEIALEADGFFGTFNHDNLNPDRADYRFKEFIDAMKEHCDISLPIKKFFFEDEDQDGNKLYCGNPPGICSLKKDDVLIIVDYNFSFPEEIEGQSSVDRLTNMPLFPDSIKFHKFEMVE